VVFLEIGKSRGPTMDSSFTIRAHSIPISVKNQSLTMSLVIIVNVYPMYLFSYALFHVDTKLRPVLRLDKDLMGLDCENLKPEIGRI